MSVDINTSAGQGGENTPRRIREEETCSSGLRRGKHALVRLG